MSYASLGTSVYDAKFINTTQRDIAIYTAEQISYARKETPLKDCTCSGFRQKVYSEDLPADPRYNEVLPTSFDKSWKYMYPDWFQGFFSEKNMLPTRTLLSMRKCQLCIANLEAASFHQAIGWDGEKFEVTNQSMTDAHKEAKFEKEFNEYVSQDHAVYAEEIIEGPYIRHRSDETPNGIPECDDDVEEFKDDTENSQEANEEPQHKSDDSGSDSWSPDVPIPSIEFDDTEDEDEQYSYENPDDTEDEDMEYENEFSDEESDDEDVSEDEEDCNTFVVSDLHLWPYIEADRSQQHGGKKRRPAPSQDQPKAKKAKTAQSNDSEEGSPVSYNRMSYGGKHAPVPGYGKYPTGYGKHPPDHFSGKRLPDNHQSVSRDRIPSSVAGKYLPAPFSGKRVPEFENGQSVTGKSLPENHPPVSEKGWVAPLQRLPAPKTRRAAPGKCQENGPKTKKVKASKPAAASKRNPSWEESEKVKLNALILARRELEKSDRRLPELYDTKLWNAMAPQLHPFTTNNRTSSSCKNFWNREGRARFGDIDRKPAPVGVVRPLITSAQGQRAKAANKIKKAQKQKKGKKQQIREETEDEDEEQQCKDDRDHDIGDLYGAD